jgi:hypothetical protein
LTSSIREALSGGELALIGVGSGTTYVKRVAMEEKNIVDRWIIWPTEELHRESLIGRNKGQLVRRGCEQVYTADEGQAEGR